MKLVHAADLHLDSPLAGLETYDGAPVGEVRGATRRALSNLVDLCLAERAELLVIAGDLYDGDWKDYSTGLYFLSQMARLADGPTRVVWARGNHDAQSQITRHLAPPAHVRELSILGPETVHHDDLGVAVHGVGYAARDVRDNLAADYPARIPGLVNIGILHTAVDGRQPHAPYAPCQKDQLRALGYEYFALGHVHAREVLSEEPWVAFPGNLQGRHIRESGPKGAYLVEISANGVEAVTHRALDVVRWETTSVDATRARSFDDVLEMAVGALGHAKEGAEGRVLATRVLVQGATEAHATLLPQGDRLQAQLRLESLSLGGIYVEDVRIQTGPRRASTELGPADALGELLARLGRRAADAADQREEMEALLKAGLESVPTDLLREQLSQLPDILADAERLLSARLLGQDVDFFAQGGPEQEPGSEES